MNLFQGAESCKSSKQRNTFNQSKTVQVCKNFKLYIFTHVSIEFKIKYTKAPGSLQYATWTRFC